MTKIVYSAHSHLSSPIRINTVSEALFLILIVTTIYMKKSNKLLLYIMYWCTAKNKNVLICGLLRPETNLILYLQTLRNVNQKNKSYCRYRVVSVCEKNYSILYRTKRRKCVALLDTATTRIDTESDWNARLQRKKLTVSFILRYITHPGYIVSICFQLDTV